MQGLKFISNPIVSQEAIGGGAFPKDSKSIEEDM